MKESHINPAFDKAIRRMEELLTQMENAVGEQISSVRAAFSAMDAAMAKAVRRKDKELNSLAKQVEEQSILVLARHQPVAKDLRHTIGALKMAIEYERVGDYVKHLAKSTGRLAAHDEKLSVYPSLMTMSGEVEKMYGSFLRARRANDVDAAVKIWMKDQLIDDICSESVREAFENQKRGDGNVQSLVHAVSVAKNLERVGDKIKNLVEIFYYDKVGEELDI